MSPTTLAGRTAPLRPALMLLGIVSMLASQHGYTAESFEQPPTLSAAKLEPNIPLQGKHYQVDSKVPTDGFLAHYTIRSELGNFRAVGPGSLAVVINEINAIATLQQIDKKGRVTKGAKKSADDMVEGVKSFVDKPEETLKGIPSGVGRFFQRSYRNLKTGAQKVQDRREGREAGAPADGPGALLPGGVADQPKSEQGNVYVDATQALGSATIDALGFDEDRRQLARELGVDPYTTNPLLDKELDEVTWAAFAGNFSVDIATSMVPGGILLSSSQRLSDWVYDTPPGDLRLNIEKRLRGMGVSQQQIDRLLRHRWYPLSLQAALVAALQDLDGVAGRNQVMPLALTVASEEQAHFVVETLRMLSQYHHKLKPLKKLQVVGTIIADTTDGELVVVAPVDYLSWNTTVARFMRNEGLDAKRYSVHLAGDISPKATTQLRQAGWQVHANSKLFVPMITLNKAGK